jgi:predicted GNAT family acetyltransferase
MLFLLEREGQIVSTCAYNARLPDAVQLGGVYTPPALRGHGYGRAVTAGALLLTREEGVSRAVLFTHEQGPARRAYEAIGFQVIGDFGLVLFR